jgi:nucleotide-binding universal stress UspA family protein
MKLMIAYDGSTYADAARDDLPRAGFPGDTERLVADGSRVSVQIESGDPKTILLAAADVWQADTIYVVAGSTNGTKLDDTASSLITTAKCTVEIVRK